MVSVTLKITNNFKAIVDRLPWINWSEMAREETLKKIEEEKALEKVKTIISKSKLTEEDAEELAEKVKLSMHKRLKRKGLI
jgi:chromosome condensin MukBEF MukE localization factor